MGFEFRILTEEEWGNALVDIGNDAVFGRLDFLHSFEIAYGVHKKLVGIYANDKPYLFMSYFESKKCIVCPNHYFFQFVWEKEKYFSWRRIMVWEFLLAQLKRKYQQIQIRLPVSVNDVRPFEWAGFKYQLKHTYIKTLDAQPYHQNIKRILSRRSDYSFAMDTDFENVWMKHSADMKAFLLPRSFIENTMANFKLLQKLKLVSTYNIYSEGELLSSIVALIDKTGSKAYFPLIGKIDASHSGAAAYLYDYALSRLKEDGILEVDLYGANMRTIARFKHKFEPKLHSFFEVKYDRRTDNLAKYASELKNMVKKVIRR